MKIYNVIVEDRHTDAAVTSFRHREDAIEYAKDYIDAIEAVDIDDSYTPEGWEYFCTYSVEGDCVWVVGTTLR